jgi:hypothetical protein
VGGVGADDRRPRQFLRARLADLRVELARRETPSLDIAQRRTVRARRGDRRLTAEPCECERAFGVDLADARRLDRRTLREVPDPGAGAAGFRNVPESSTINAPRIGEVYTKGTLTLARLGREAPIAAASPDGPVLRNIEGGSLAARELYPEIRQTGPEKLPRSPVIGTDAPVQYEQRDDIGAPRRRNPSRS